MSDDDATKKYHQIVVPDHSLKPGAGGTSFLRTGTFPSLTDKTKQPPGFKKSVGLARLAGDHHLKTGGSWHHVDGNRVETTTGRKVEVIAGSYVAHRGPGNSPGPNFSATWATTSYTQVGSLDLPVGYSPDTSPATAPNATNVDPVAGFVETMSYNYDGSMGAEAGQALIETNQPPPNPNPANTPVATTQLSPGDVLGVTWAQRIMTYVGSPKKPVPLVYAETWAMSMHSFSNYSVESKTFVGSDASPVPLVYAQTWAGEMQTYVGTDDNPVPTVIARTDAGSSDTRTFAHTGDITTWNHAVGASGAVWQDTVAVGILTTQEAKADISVFNTAPIMTTVNTGLVQATINLAAFMTTMNIGPQLTVNIPTKTQFTIDEQGFHVTKTDTDAAHTALVNAFTNLADVVSLINNAQVTIGNTTMQLGNGSTDLSAFIVKGL